MGAATDAEAAEATAAAGRLCMVADRGATVHIVSKAMAATLAAAGLVAPFVRADGEDRTIIFGKATATSPVLGAFDGWGKRPIITDVHVVEELECGLVSDRLLTQQGYVLFNSDEHLMVLKRVGGTWVTALTARRDVRAQEGSPGSLWAYDVEKLFTAQVPEEEDDGDADGGDAEQLGAGCVDGGGGEEHFAGSARPTFTIDDVRRARAVLKNWGNGSARGKVLTLQHNAMLDVPEWLTPALMQHIGARNDNPRYAMCKRLIPSRGGSGVHVVQVGKRVSCDDIGKLPMSTWGATYAGLFMDVASRYIVAFAMSEKTTMCDALKLYREQAVSFGHQVDQVQADATSVIGEDFLREIHALKMEVVQAAAEDQAMAQHQARHRAAAYFAGQLHGRLDAGADPGRRGPQHDGARRGDQDPAGAVHAARPEPGPRHGVSVRGAGHDAAHGRTQDRRSAV